MKYIYIAKLLNYISNFVIFWSRCFQSQVGWKFYSFACYTVNSYSISHPRCTVTTRWLDSDGVVTGDKCQQHGAVTLLAAVNNSDYTVTVQSPCSHCAAWVTDGIGVYCVAGERITTFNPLGFANIYFKILGNWKYNLKNRNIHIVPYSFKR